MLVSEPHKALVLALKNPGKVTTVIPKAKILIEEPGRTVLAVPHTLDVYRVLTNIGFTPPHPIKHYYAWPCYYPTRYEHQEETAAFLSRHRRAYCLNGMGSMKTLSTLWAFDYLLSIGKARRMLVVAPLSTLERTWADEVFRHFPHLTCVTLHGTKARRIKLLGSGAEICVINHDGIKVVQTELLAAGFDVVCLDELTQVARNPSTDRWKAAKLLVQQSEYAWGLTGTPIPNDPDDAYGQIKLLTPERVPRSFRAFQDMVSRLVGPYKRMPLPTATQTIYDMMQPSIRYATRDCVELPPTIYLERQVELSAAQLSAFKRMEREKIFQVSATGQKIVAVNEAVVAMKLIQLAIGAIRIGDEDGDIERLECPERLAVVKEVIGEAEGKVIVFCPFLGGVDYITDELRAYLGEHAVHRIDGRVTKAQRDETYRAFQQDTAPRVIVAQPSAMSHGITLTKANVIVWFAPCYSNETYEQANARIVRPGQKRKTVIVNVQGTALERRIYKRLKDRQAVQGKLLEMVEES